MSHGQSNVEKTLKQFTCSYKSIKLDIHATSQKYRVTLQEQNWYTMVSLPNIYFVVAARYTRLVKMKEEHR